MIKLISMSVPAIAICLVVVAPIVAPKNSGSARPKATVPHALGIGPAGTERCHDQRCAAGGKFQSKDVLSGEEAEEFQQQLANDLSRDRRDGGADADVNRAYNEHWMDSRRLKITSDHRTSLIVDPPDGRIPPTVALSPERERARVARAAANVRFNAGLPDRIEDFSLPVRCIIRRLTAGLPTICS
jgi:hypothetical protein